ncbi:MAG TPA: TIGR03087 family PEP-CTERM/XrtA system glycosyltransferase [Casimicrobiaceae bacterium]|nr:TIGR03087 family PEP-CTERM/XrtA system glycosyltransferase [Casimicrobiaceae bacterium]
MNILYVCHRFPFPPKRGGKIRPFNMIRHFARDHRVTVASLVRSEEEGTQAQGIAAHCHRFEMARVHDTVQALRMVARLPTSVPSSLGFFYSSKLKRRIREALERERFDLIFVHCSSVAHYVEDVTGIPKILDFGDMDSQKWLEYARYKPFPLSLGYALEGRKLEREERRLATRFDVCTATTRAEWQTLESFRADVATDWFPNGVDSEFFCPTHEPYDPDHLVFVGRMDYYPNQECMIEFCTRVLPRLQQSRPRVTLAVVGADPSAAVRRLGTLPGVTVTGSVADVRPFARRAAVMVAPLNIARGTQNKILEGMAMGVPVVASRIAAGGVDAEAGVHLRTASSVDDYVMQILTILDDPLERQRLANEGRARVLSHHSWSASMTKLDGIVARCVAMRGVAPRSESTTSQAGMLA